jgi:hypothetical protein
MWWPMFGREHATKECEGEKKEENQGRMTEIQWRLFEGWFSKGCFMVLEERDASVHP